MTNANENFDLQTTQYLLSKITTLKSLLKIKAPFVFLYILLKRIFQVLKTLYKSR